MMTFVARIYRGAWTDTRTTPPPLAKSGATMEVKNGNALLQVIDVYLRDVAIELEWRPLKVG